MACINSPRHDNALTMIDVGVMEGQKHMATCGVTAFDLEPPSCISLFAHYPTLDNRIPSHEDVSTFSLHSAFVRLNMAASTRFLSPCLGTLVVVTLVCLDKVPGCLGTARNLTNTFALTRAQRQCQDSVSAFLFSILSRSLLPHLNVPPSD